MSKWEYCRIVGWTYGAFIDHFTVNGVQRIELKGEEEAEVARAITQLGDEGWEMVGLDTVGIMYFKRPKL